MRKLFVYTMMLAILALPGILVHAQTVDASSIELKASGNTLPLDGLLRVGINVHVGGTNLPINGVDALIDYDNEFLEIIGFERGDFDIYPEEKFLPGFLKLSGLIEEGSIKGSEHLLGTLIVKPREVGETTLSLRFDGVGKTDDTNIAFGGRDILNSVSGASISIVDQDFDQNSVESNIIVYVAVGLVFLVVLGILFLLYQNAKQKEGVITVAIFAFFSVIASIVFFGTQHLKTGAVLGTDNTCSYDLNSDSTINSIDYSLIMSALSDSDELQTYDLNKDGSFDFMDSSLLFNNFHVFCIDDEVVVDSVSDCEDKQCGEGCGLCEDGFYCEEFQCKGSEEIEELLATSKQVDDSGSSNQGNGSTSTVPGSSPTPTQTPTPILSPTLTATPVPTPSVTPSPTPISQTGALHNLRVLELRYFPKGEEDVVYHPDDLSADLQNLLSQGSKYHLYSDSAAPSSLNVQIVDVINRYKARPNVNGWWYTTYKLMLAEDNLCQRINNENIDQVWLWVDPRPGYDPGPGVEYAISSDYFETGAQYATVANPAFCGGTNSFVIMGFDFTRTADWALHSYGHFMEGLLGNLQTVELFWYRFGGNTSAGWPLDKRCGNVHFPPNGASDYDYSNGTTVTGNWCEDWDPYGDGSKQSFNCSKWGCTQEGYLKWWMQSIPGYRNTVVYESKLLPSWWDFIGDMDGKINYYKNNPSYFFNHSFIP